MTMTDDQSAGATPVVPGVTPGQTDDQAADATAASVTGDADNLKRALDAERAQRRELEKSLKAERVAREALETSQLSEHEKAIAQARTEAMTEATTKAHAMVRRAEVRRALASAGIAADSLDLAAGAPEFAGLAVDDSDGTITDIDKTVAAFRAAHPSLFSAPRAAAGNFDGGTGGGSAAVTFSRATIGAMCQAEYERAERDILAAAREGRIRD